MEPNDRGSGRAPPETVEEYRAALAALQEEAADLRDKYLRSAAAVENTRKQAAREAEARIADRLQRLSRRLLEVADNLERALAHAAEDDPLRQGVQVTLDQLQAALSQEGVEPISVEIGAPFDPHLHEAVSGISGDVERETVAAILQRGYTFDGQVLRPARVVVALPTGRKQ